MSHPRTPIPARGGPAAVRRRAALGPSGHAVADLSGFDGDVWVRYEAVYRRAEAACGERRLLLAVLEDGIRTLLKCAGASHGRALTLWREALAWLTAEERTGVFMFESICEALGIEAAQLRARVLAAAERGEPRASVH